MIISHKNCLSSYLGHWLTVMDVKARAEGRPSSGLRVTQPLQSLMRHKLNLCLMLELFDECLTRFERSLNSDKADCDYGAYSEAICFLDAIYFFAKMLLDSVAGIVRHRDLNKSDRGRELPKRFNVMYKESLKGKLPTNLNTVFSECKPWFPQLKARRDAIVHDYETYLIVFGQNSEGKKTAQQFSPRENAHAIDDEDLRSYIGMVMAGYQRFVDGLLDYWDEMFRCWYGITESVNSRTLTIFEDRNAKILWWAYQYGGYRNDNMVVSES